MENELNYLSDKIDDLEWEVSYYNREVAITESEQKRTDMYNILERKETELELLQNILNVVEEMEADETDYYVY
tara:strand:- start:47 stop:265 length:219 start_codon:yes stop_codon:yes gene_type:complete